MTDYTKSSYRIVCDKCIATGSKKLTCTPIQLVSYNGNWSGGAIGNGTSIPNNAKITSAYVSGEQGKVKNGLSPKVCVRVGNDASDTVLWKSGDVALDGLIDKNASAKYYVSLAAGEKPVIIRAC